MVSRDSSADEPEKRSSLQAEPDARPADPSPGLGVQGILQRVMWATVAAAIVLVFVLSPLIGMFVEDYLKAHLLLCAAAYVVVLAVVLATNRSGFWGAILLFWVATLVAFFFFSATQPSTRISTKAKEAEVKQNLHAIQLGLERYAYRHDGVLPTSVAELLSDPESMARLPTNPLSEPHCQMQGVSFHTEEPYGDFTYVPVGEEDRIVGYYLLAYGSERTRGMDVDGDGEGDRVILVLSSEDTEYDPVPFEGEYQGTLPPLSSLLQE